MKNEPNINSNNNNDNIKILIEKVNSIVKENEQLEQQISRINQLIDKKYKRRKRRRKIKR